MTPFPPDPVLGCAERTTHNHLGTNGDGLFAGMRFLEDAHYIGRIGEQPSTSPTLLAKQFNVSRNIIHPTWDKGSISKAHMFTWKSAVSKQALVDVAIYGIQ